VSEESQAGDKQANAAEKAARVFAGREIPPWFGILEKYARRVERHDIEAIRESIARGMAEEHGL